MIEAKTKADGNGGLDVKAAVKGCFGDLVIEAAAIMADITLNLQNERLAAENLVDAISKIALSIIKDNEKEQGHNENEDTV